MSETRMPAIQALNLKKQFGSITAVDDVSFTVESGEIFGFLGPNGAGKTTTIRLLTGVLTPDSGTIHIDGRNMLNAPLSAKMVMGIIPESSTVYGDLTAEQNLSLTGKFYGLDKDIREMRSKELLTRLDLYNRRDHLVKTFSKGMRQRISIACAIIHRPHVLFLDEPTEGLDVKSRKLIYDAIYEMNEGGSTVFLTTHNIEEANRLCHRVCVINNGKIVAIDRPEHLRSTFDTTQSVEVSFAEDVKKDWFLSDSISKIDQHGDVLRFFTDNPDRTVKMVVTSAQERDLTIKSLKISGPSLEEAFIRLTGDS